MNGSATPVDRTPPLQPRAHGDKGSTVRPPRAGSRCRTVALLHRPEVFHSPISIITSSRHDCITNPQQNRAAFKELLPWPTKRHRWYLAFIKSIHCNQTCVSSQSASSFPYCLEKIMNKTEHPSILAVRTLHHCMCCYSLQPFFFLNAS